MKTNSPMIIASRRKQLLELIQRDAIKPDALESALLTSKVWPNTQMWKTYLDRVLLWFASMALCLSVLFFIAFNWDQMGVFFKFALIELLIVAAFGIYWLKHENELIAKVSLFGATILVGVLLALVGQTYQTGADPWELFFSWALLILPWALVGRFPVIWVLWLVLLNLTIALYDGTMRSVLHEVTNTDEYRFWLFFGVNALALVVWEYLAGTIDWMAERWVPRLMAVAGGIPITMLVLENIFANNSTWHAYAVWLVGVSALVLIYQSRIKDLFMLAGLCLSVIIIVTSFIIETQMNNFHIDSLLMIALFIIILGTSSALWLKHIQKRWQL